ncbi:hypothetical protein [Psychrobacillus sp.]|uniref:hypothetical protein n=1 Tax=Psychrobacillus sp. TaxID=1871623 RepID=UPI0028BF1BDA|nr:hypothetical protein [Psychrobacillus sp.]
MDQYFNSTEEMERGSEFLMLEEKLKILWLYEGDKKDYLINGDIDDLNNDYFSLTNYLHGPVFDNGFIRE